MDITDATKKLNRKVQQLKPNYTDSISTAFIDFYCQCREGCDYLFPQEVKETIRLFDILKWFIESVEHDAPTPLVSLMWHDVIGPTWGEYQEDERSEQTLRQAIASGTLKEQLEHWDLVRNPDGSVWLTLRELLRDISHIEQEQTQQSN